MNRPLFSGSGLSCGKGPPARYVATRRFNLDDVGTEVSKQFGSESPRDALAAFNDLDRIER
jgi:hypothetical protein